MKVKLLVVGGEAKAAEINLKLPTVIGRGREATLALPHPLVSRKHCEIYEVNGQLRVRDLDSLNGTYVADQRVTDAAIPPGELLTVGTVTFRAVYGDEVDFADDETLPPAIDAEEIASGPTTRPNVAETVPKAGPSAAPASEAEQKARITSDTAWQPSPRDENNPPSGHEEFRSFLSD
jgi:predicted component of type VI protein secretion system